MRALLLARGEAPAGYLEGAAARVLREYCVEGFTRELRIEDDGVFIARVDFGRNDIKLALEFDGFSSHSSPAELQADHQRQNRLERAGWTVLRFTMTDVVTRPWYVAATITSTVTRLLATKAAA